VCETEKDRHLLSGLAELDDVGRVELEVVVSDTVICIHVCVCVREGEREREVARARVCVCLDSSIHSRNIKIQRFISTSIYLSIQIYIFMEVNYPAGPHLLPGLAEFDDVRRVEL